VNPRRLVTLIYVVLLSAFGVGAGALFLDARAEYNKLKRSEAETRRLLVEAETRLRQQERILERLRTDPEYLKKVMQRQLNYTQPGELIFRFED
jgi:cell division protein DivIC